MKRIILLLLLMAGMILLIPGCASIVAASPDDSGEIEIVLSDYTFEPNVIRLKAGQTVHIKLRNEGDKMHEIMAGRDVQIHGNFTEGFGQDFFAGITPEISGPGMVMGGPEGMDMGGMEMGEGEMDMSEGEMTMEDGDHEDDDMEMGEDDDHAEEGMEMDEEPMDMGEDDDHSEDDMAMGEEEHEEDDGHAEDGMDMGDGDHEDGEADEHDEEGVAGTFGALQMPEMDAHAGLMVMIDPQIIPAGEVTTITFTVPEDKVGRWQMGCFQERGQHYDDGMNGVIIVEP